MLRSGFFAIVATMLIGSILQADDWPQWFGPNRDGIWREDGILTKFPAGGPKQIWKTDLGPGYSGPAVANGLVYVMDRQAEKIAGNPAKANSSPGYERVLCLDAATGKEVWKHEYECKYQRISYGFGPRTTPTVVGDKVYTLGAMGDLKCLDAKSGKLIWSVNFVKEHMTLAPVCAFELTDPLCFDAKSRRFAWLSDFSKELRALVPIWGWSSNPLADGDKIICLVGGESKAVVAFDRNNGKKLWSALTTQEVGYCPPVIFEIGGKRQLIIWHSDSVNSLNPETGEVYWTEKYPRDVRASRPAAPISTPRLEGDVLFITSYYHGPIAFKLDNREPKATLFWRAKTDDANKVGGLRSLIGTPVIKDGHIYGICRSGEMRCNKLDTGEQVWESLEHQDDKKAQFGAAFIIPHKDRFFIFTDAGNLIVADLSPKGYKEISRAKIIEPTQANSGRDVVWCHPAFANKCVFVRNDREIVCVSLAG